MKRPQNMSLEDYILWVMEHELEFPPADWEKDCWTPRKGIARVRGVRPIAYWKGKNLLMYQLTYMAWHGLEESPFSQSVHASHTCDNSECVNPLHIVPESASENELRKLDNADAYRKAQREHQLALRREGKPIMPQDLTHRERAQWLLDNKTWIDEKGCMRWTGQQNEKGYGRHNIRIAPGKTKKVEVHRYIHCMMNGLPYGEDPNDEWNGKGKGFKVAHHKCEQPNCVNPDHIELVSRAQNAWSITNNRSRKVTEKNVRDIIEDFLRVTDWPYGSKAKFSRKWAEELSVSTDLITNIVFRKVRWVPLLEEYGLIEKRH